MVKSLIAIALIFGLSSGIVFAITAEREQRVPFEIEVSCDVTHPVPIENKPGEWRWPAPEGHAQTITLKKVEGEGFSAFYVAGEIILNLDLAGNKADLKVVAHFEKSKIGNYFAGITLTTAIDIGAERPLILEDHDDSSGTAIEGFEEMASDDKIKTAGYRIFLPQNEDNLWHVSCVMKKK